MLRVTFVRRMARRIGGSSSAPVAATKTATTPAVVEDPWQEVKDANGQSYWWNKSTSETTAVGAPKPDPNAWQEVKDPTTGQSYWWNQQTNQTTAIGAPRPSAVMPPPSQAVAPAQSGGLMGALADGLAWGVGTSVASRMMDGILGPRQMEVVHRHEGGDAASPPPPGSSGDSGGGEDLSSQGWSWGESSGNNDSGGSSDSGGGWFGGGDSGGDGSGPQRVNGDPFGSTACRVQCLQRPTTRASALAP